MKAVNNMEEILKDLEQGKISVDHAEELILKLIPTLEEGKQSEKPEQSDKYFDILIKQLNEKDAEIKRLISERNTFEKKYLDLKKSIA